MKNLIKKIKENLTPDLLKGKWKHQSSPLSGHCYVATEALYHSLKDKENYKPMYATYTTNFGDGTHWWLQHKETGERIDITASQFRPTFLEHLYWEGRGAGFLTKNPSKRAKILMDRVKLD